MLRLRKSSNTNELEDSSQFTLNPEDSKFVREIAKKLDIPEVEVLKKGIKIMNIYADAYKANNATLILEDKETRKELIVVEEK